MFIPEAADLAVITISETTKNIEIKTCRPTMEVNCIEYVAKYPL